MALACARKLFADLMCALEEEVDRLRAAQNAATEVEECRRLEDLVRRNQKALQSVLDCQLKLSRRAGRACPGEGVIDLEAAREEIHRRLARLAARG